MAESLREKLLKKGWVTEFNVDTLVRLIEQHYGNQEPVPEPSGKELREAYVLAYYACEDRQGPAAQEYALRAILAKFRNVSAPKESN